ncbi:cobalt-precorrin-6A reductase [Maritimibacter sp. DP1N21-5]|uniref:cobalt-precorrin-6A reductase n=1 Tax=Maritimibacter sp. DP1N21-5 TaxID=2836867 RepID=UPI001C47A65D|nr:cobalt-precorrin-6A reductase [Maritimibacter sp. DP1N21-5]MBV7409969.1 cobalt-precorrin-6A reductase [Maritimibacter sp. DP1N21-5]
MKILLLAGTTEARALAARLDRDGRIDLTVSLAGATRSPLPLQGNLRTGGFGSREAQKKFMQGMGFDAVIDATHPFAARITERTAEICRSLGLPRLVLLRPPWQPGPGDDWQEVESAARVGDHVKQDDVVFLATGPGSLDAIGPLDARRILCRRIDPTDQPFPWMVGNWLVGRPPFDAGDEIETFREEGVTLLVTKNAGGTGGEAKLVAARQLGLPVIMISRPPPPAGEVVETLEQAIDWVDRL